jgi:DNA-binding transcriptional MerR regulator
MSPLEIPDKLYFKIGEVAEIAGVEPYVLRYWESEFKEVSPVKSRSNQRLYRRKDIEIVLRIKELLYKEGFTIEGARKQIRESPKGEKEANRREQMPLPFENGNVHKLLKKLKIGLEDLLKILEK